MQRQRVNVPFRKVTGKELMESFFRISLNPKEKTIEQTYVGKTSLATTGFVEIGAVDNDDGAVYFHNGRDRHSSFVGRQETKRNVKPIPSVLHPMLLQSLHYDYQDRFTIKFPIQYKYKVFILTSSKFFAYVLREDIQKIIDKLDVLFKSIKCSASKVWKQIEFRSAIEHEFSKLNFHIYNIEDKFELNKAYRDIYLDCLN